MLIQHRKSHTDTSDVKCCINTSIAAWHHYCHLRPPGKPQHATAETIKALRDSVPENTCLKSSTKTVLF
ncbi:hypothetical protein AOLI_G00311370 [Acnodon oligacanthus]